MWTTIVGSAALSPKSSLQGNYISENAASSVLLHWNSNFDQWSPHKNCSKMLQILKYDKAQFYTKTP